MPSITEFSCPLPRLDHDTVQLAHGSGGRLSAELIDKLFLPRFANPVLNRLEDQATLTLPAGRLAMTTDSFVVDPIFFPGGNIGELAVNGTVNDLAMGGATPLYLSVGFILEEGLPLAHLHRVLLSMENAAAAAGVQVVTGDTKVVNRGSCDRVFINTTGLGVIGPGTKISAANIRVGDVIIVSGTIADHGMAVLTCRQNLSFTSRIASDTAALNGLVKEMLTVCPEIHTLRDPTRGGLATTLNEVAVSSDIGIQLQEAAIPVRPEVRGACEVLGIDPLYVANEGKLVAAVPAAKSNVVLVAMHRHPYGKDAAIIGRAVADHPHQVTIQTALGAERIVAMPVGEQLPRIC